MYYGVCVWSIILENRLCLNYMLIHEKSRYLHISHTSVMLNLLNFAKNSLNTFDWTKLNCFVKKYNHANSALLGSATLIQYLYNTSLCCEVNVISSIEKYVQFCAPWQLFLKCNKLFWKCKNLFLYVNKNWKKIYRIFI